MTHPPYTITAAIHGRVAAIEETLATLAAGRPAADILPARLQRAYRARSIHATLAMEGNTLSPEEVRDVIDGRAATGPARDILEVRGALAAHEKLVDLLPYRMADLLAGHGLLMHGLVEQPGRLRTGGGAVFRGDRVVHMAPPARLVHGHMERLLGWLEGTGEHPLVAGCVFHCEFEFIHPFADGNGRMGRLWQALVLGRWHPLLAFLPVEATILERRAGYYESLARADREGEATGFVEFMLAAIGDALDGIRSDLAGNREPARQAIRQPTK